MIFPFVEQALKLDNAALSVVETDVLPVSKQDG